MRGGVSVEKRDSKTGERPQGDADFSGIQFEIVNKSKNPVEVGGKKAAPGEVAVTITTNAQGVATTGPNVLPYGDYIIREKSTNASMLKTFTEEIPVTVAENGKMYTFTAENDVVRGGIAVEKRDSKTGERPQGDADFSGITFEIVNSSRNPVEVEGATYAPGQVVTTLVTDESGYASTEDKVLPYGTYTLREVSTNESMLQTFTEQTVQVREHKKIYVVTAENEVVRGGGSAKNVNLSADVIALMPQISAACQTHSIPEYAPLVAAVIMQESGGRAADVGGDVMQCAEGMGLPVGTPVSVEESINFGTGIIARNLREAGATGPTDIPAISLALQGYNFGNGYISWALARGGYTKENAREFSEWQAGLHGWSGYGDIDYVDHVLRYYQVAVGGMGETSAIADGRFAYPLPGHSWDTYPGHNGIDISFANCYGEPVYAVAAGTVRYTQDGWTSAHGVGGMWSFGNSVFIEHGDGWISAYGHLSALAVASGETVVQGQLIGYIGSTGNSTGPHLHLALYHNGDAGFGGQNFAELAWPQYSK